MLIHGLPEIDVSDWMTNTEYSGLFSKMEEGKIDYVPVCEWFWDVVDEMDMEKQARLLQFVTGTAGVPARGFSALQGYDGDLRMFCIHGVSLATCLYPRAHTCFNRLDLPIYESKSELKEKLDIAITFVATGFDLE